MDSQSEPSPRHRTRADPLIIAADLAEPDAAPLVVDQALATFGRIDALLNMAGAVPQIDLFEMTDPQ